MVPVLQVVVVARPLEALLQEVLPAVGQVALLVGPRVEIILGELVVALLPAALPEEVAVTYREVQLLVLLLVELPQAVAVPVVVEALQGAQRAVAQLPALR
jgi:hypothetical protein